jgi:thiol-disulfide isomerase/thioredoxin
MRTVRLLAVLMVASVSVPSRGAAAEPPLTVALELVAKDAHGRAVGALDAADLVVMQDGVRQKIASLTAQSQPGHFELIYAPASGKAGALTVRALRPGLTLSGPDGGGLAPHVVTVASPLEAELTRRLDARPDSTDFPMQLQAFRFEPTADGLHYTLAVEVPLHTLPAASGATRLQILVRLRNADRVLETLSTDRSIPSSSLQSFVWTAQVRLKPGRYELEAIAREAESAKASTRRISVEVPSVPAGGPRLSSVALLQPPSALVVRDRVREDDDPFFLNGQPVMPALEAKTPRAAGAKVAFFTIVYPDSALKEPTGLTLKVVRNGSTIGSTPIALPAPDAHGEIRYSGAVPIASFIPADYTLVLEAQQGEVGASSEAAFTIVPDGMPAGNVPIRIESSAATGGAPAAAPTPQSRELAAARALVQHGRPEQAIPKLKKLDQERGGHDLDVQRELAVAYFRTGAFKDGEVLTRQLLESTKDQPQRQADLYLLLGRLLAEGEKHEVQKESPRLVEATACFEKALTLSDGRMEAARLARAEMLFRLDRADEARASLQALTATPHASDAALDRARQLLQSPRCATEPCLPQVSFVTAEGEHKTAEDLRGKVVLLSFWATWCGPCMSAMPELKKIYASFHNEPFVMVGVNDDTDRETMEAFVKAHGIEWPQVTGEESSRLGDGLGIRGIPAELVFDQDGVFQGRTAGWGSETGRALATRIRETLKKVKRP